MIVGAMTGCATSTQTTGGGLTDSAIATQIANRAFDAEMRQATPMRMPPVNLTSDYHVKISHDTIVSELPYFGVAHTASFNEGSALNFTSRITGYTARTEKAGRHRVDVTTRHGNDELHYSFIIYDNGNVSLDVIPQQRDRIGFTGSLREKE